MYILTNAGKGKLDQTAGIRQQRGDRVNTFSLLKKMTKVVE